MRQATHNNPFLCLPQPSRDRMSAIWQSALFNGISLESPNTFRQPNFRQGTLQRNIFVGRSGDHVAMKSRKKINSSTELDVLTRSRRRCCICFGLHRDVGVKSGQIAHLDGNRSNGAADNLAFLCLVHHDQYDSTTKQSKNLTVQEVKKYRAELFDQVLPVVEAQMIQAHAIAIPAPEPNNLPFDVHRQKELKAITLEVISEIPSPLPSVLYLAKRLGISSATAERILFELAQDGFVRIDRPRGSMRKTYSMVTAPENRLIDTFVSQLASAPVTDDRFIRRGQYELDAIICVDNRTAYAVETMRLQDRLSREDAAKRIERLETTKRQVGIPDATSVLLIRITNATKCSKDDLRTLERPGLLIRYVEMG